MWHRSVLHRQHRPCQLRMPSAVMPLWVPICDHASAHTPGHRCNAPGCSCWGPGGPPTGTHLAALSAVKGRHACGRQRSVSTPPKHQRPVRSAVPLAAPASAAAFCRSSCPPGGRRQPLPPLAFRTPPALTSHVMAEQAHSQPHMHTQRISSRRVLVFILPAGVCVPSHRGGAGTFAVSQL